MTESGARERGHRLYVFELADSVGSRRRIPRRRSDAPFVYVGYTSKSRRVRLREHRTGRFAADKKWAPHYVRAWPDLYRLWPVYPTQEMALVGETQLAKVLETRGFTVVNKTGTPIAIAASRA